MPESRADQTKAAGVCLACSYNCHENHELIELYTKRNFRCDCGLKGKMPNNCSLDNIKLDENTLNKYNQNFSSFYCNCHRPYPDPEDSIADEMIQCIGCEDWYHSRHLNAKMPSANAYSEMICEMCMEKNEFLRYYVGLSVFAAPDDSMNNSTLNVTSIDDSIVSVSCDDVEEKKEGKRPLENGENIDEPAEKKVKVEGDSQGTSEGKKFTYSVTFEL